MTHVTYHRPLHAAALVLTAATFPLIFMGGLVTTHGAGMAVPDWPNSYGYNMFTFPPSEWIGGVWYEHVHRLMGTVVGFLAIILVMQAWGPARVVSRRRKLAAAVCSFTGIAVVSVIAVVWLERVGTISHDRAKQLQHFVVLFASLALILAAAWTARRPDERRWVRWLCVAALIAVCVQGLLGGLRVTEVNLTLAIIHGCFAHAFFCLAACIAVVTSPWWALAPDLSQSMLATRGRRLIPLSIVCAVAVYVQLVIGATMRHHGAGLAIPDLPWAYGKLLPPIDAGQLSEVNHYRAWTLHEKPVTLGQIWLHFGHRAGAIAVTALMMTLIVAACRSGQKSVRTIATALTLLLLTQFTLGVLTVLWKKPADIASLHVAVGALLLMTTVVLTIKAARLYSVVVQAHGSSQAVAPERKVCHAWNEYQTT